MSKLHLADNLSLPLDACTQTFAWIGRKGSGKTYGAGKLVEELLKASVQTVILDTVGNWYGLRIAADGKGKGFDVPVFGGLRQDLPLLSTAGEVVADVVMDSRRSARHSVAGPGCSAGSPAHDARDQACPAGQAGPLRTRDDDWLKLYCWTRWLLPPGDAGRNEGDITQL